MRRNPDHSRVSAVLPFAGSTLGLLAMLVVAATTGVAMMMG